MAPPHRSSRTRNVGLIAAFVGITLGLAYCWLSGGSGLYMRFFRAVAEPFYSALGATDYTLLSRTRYANLIPFVGLMVVTPWLSLRRRALGLVVGLAGLVLSHLLLNLLGAESSGYRLPLAARWTLDGAPFLFWVLIARPSLARLGARALSTADAEGAPPPG